MAYTRNSQWKDWPDRSTPTSAARLEHMESGIESAAEVADDAASAVVTLTDQVDQVSQVADAAAPATELAALADQVGNAAPLKDVQGLADGHAGPFMARLVAGQENLALLLLGDSTANGTNEWFYQLCQYLAELHPAYTVKHRLWNDTTQAYDAPTVLQVGAVVGQTVVFQDTFSRADGELVGDLPNIGPAWTGDPGQVSVINGQALAPNASGNLGFVYADPGANDNLTISADVILADVTVASKLFRLYFRMKDTNNQLFAEVIYSTSSVGFNIYKRIGGVATSIASIGGVIVPPSLGATVTLPLSISIAGGNVSATIAGKSIGGVLSGTDLAALTGTKLSFTSFVGAGGGLDNLLVATGLPAPTLEVYNGSMPGAATSYFTGTPTRFDSMTPVAPGLVMFNLGHNHFEPVTQFRGLYYGLVRKLLAKYPLAPVVCTSQNVRTAPRSSIEISNHYQRMAKLRELCGQEGWGYIPIIEAFLATGNPSSFVDPADGIHPTQSGDDFWAAEVQRYFRDASLISTNMPMPPSARVLSKGSQMALTNPSGAYPKVGVAANGLGVMLFDKVNGGNQGVGDILDIPSHWSTVNISAVWAPSDATAGNVRWRFGLFAMSETTIPTLDAETFTTAAASGALDVPVKTVLRSGIAAPTRPFAFRLIRATGDALDTYSGQAKLLYLTVERVD